MGLGPGCSIQKLIDDPKKQKNHELEEQRERERMKLALGLDAPYPTLRAVPAWPFS